MTGYYRASIGHNPLLRVKRAFPAFTPGDVALSLTFGPGPGTADFYIPAGTATVTFVGTSTTHPGVTGPSRAVQPGDIIELAPGTHGRRNFTNVIGGSGNRITIRNGNGKAIIRSATVVTGGFVNSFTNCRHFNVDGSTGGQTYGIKWMYSADARLPAGTDPGAKDSYTSMVKFTSANSTTMNTDNCTFTNFEIDGGWNQTPSQSLQTDGIGLQTNDSGVLRVNNPGEFQENMKFLNFRIVNVEGEGMYVGPNFQNGTCPLRNIEIGFGITDMTGSDGINGKSWYEGTNSVHDCTVTRAARDSTPPGTPGSISILSGLCDVYNCIVEDGGIVSGPNNNGTGIKLGVDHGPLVNTSFNGYGPYSVFDIDVYNNVVSGCVFGHGISAGGDTGTVPYRAKIYSNTSIDNFGTGLKTTNDASGSFIKNCISVGNSPNASAGGSTTASSNLTTGTSGTLLTAPSTSNYHLSAAGEISALGCSGTKGTDYASLDLDGASRPATAANAHKGAYET